MKIGLHDYDNTKYPNLALMKLSAWHKQQGDIVEFVRIGEPYDKVYSSRVFTFTPNLYRFEGKVEYGGTGHDISVTLPDEIEHICPDYSLYNCEQSYGFLTRGCIRRCKECFVPEKEGVIRPHADIAEFIRHRDVVLMDNNVLASSHGIEQIDKMARMGIRVDFNQGLDARLIDDKIARKLRKLQWIRYIRLACDSIAMIESVRKAVEILRWNNVNPAQIFCYVLVREDIEDALERLRVLKGLYVHPFAQPYRDKEGTEPTKEQKDLARWVNHKAIFKSVLWEDYGKV